MPLALINVARLLLIASALTLAAHLLWLVWVIAGAFLTRNRPVLASLHIASLVWGIIVEVGPWPCPLTLLEEFFDRGAETESRAGGFIAHWLEALIYPDLPGWLVTASGVAVCLANLSVYAWRYRRQRRQNNSSPFASH